MSPKNMSQNCIIPIQSVLYTLRVLYCTINCEKIKLKFFPQIFIICFGQINY